ncbi:hypothetical protein D3C73_1033520 [compost metagenome]
MRGAREAVGAAVLAAAIRIHRLAEADVRGVVAADDAARGLGMHFGAQAWGEEFFALVHRPAVVHRLADGAFEAPGKVGRGTPALDGGLGVARGVLHVALRPLRDISIIANHRRRKRPGFT